MVHPGTNGYARIDTNRPATPLPRERDEQLECIDSFSPRAKALLDARPERITEVEVVCAAALNDGGHQPAFLQLRVDGADVERRAAVCFSARSVMAVAAIGGIGFQPLSH
jgi:hypothetical protein